LGVSGSGVALALLACTVAKTVPCRGRKRGKRKFLRKSQLWSQDFTAKLFCNVEFWLERLPKLIGLLENTAIKIQNYGLDPFTKPPSQIQLALRHVNRHLLLSRRKKYNL
jgi:hypothetical protein